MGLPPASVIIGNELSLKTNPGSGLGMSVNPGGLMVIGPTHPVPGRQCASWIEPMVESGLGNSSQVVQKPRWPSEAMADPCEYVDPGAFSFLIGGVEVGPPLNS